MAVEVAASEQTRARYPDEEGYVERDGVRVFYEVYGSGEPTVLLLPTWSIIHSRQWKMQIPYLARHCRVVTFDGRGNGTFAFGIRCAELDGRRARLFALAEGMGLGLAATGTHPWSQSRGWPRSGGCSLAKTQYGWK